MNVLNLFIKILGVAGTVFGSLYIFRTVFVVVGFFFTRKFKKAEKDHKYAILIAARNEETVIGNLIDSIEMQDYDRSLLTVFVVADNCTDKTAEIARERGAVCYERFDSEHRTKGFAIQFLVENIKNDYGIDAFEGYFLFDADNLLKQDYITRMNEAFDAGEKIITSYRNTKNFADNWIAASYGLHWLRTVRSEHRARSFFKLATRIQGTGFLFASEVIKDGWNYTSLTEDRAFCADAVASGYEISYNHDAIFYDEQPVDIKVAMRQRIRWAKGHLQAFVETGPQLFKHIFYVPKSVSSGKGIVKNLKVRFMSFDMLTVVLPHALFNIFKKLAVLLLRVALICSAGYIFGESIAPGAVKKILNFFDIHPANGITSIYGAILFLLLFTFLATIVSYCEGMLIALYVFIFEHKRIPPIPWYKKLWFIFTFPIFDLIGKISMVIALFIKVEWKTIPHNSDVKISDIQFTTKT